MKEFDVNKASAWIGIAAVAISTVVTFTQLFGRVDGLADKIAVIEKKNEERDVEQKKRDDEQRKRDDELQKKLTERDAELQTSLGKIDKSLDFANWRIGAITEGLKEKRR